MKSTLDSLKSVFNVFRRKPLGTPERVALYKHHFRERFTFSVYFSCASLFFRQLTTWSLTFHSYSAISCECDNVEVEENCIMLHKLQLAKSVYFYFIFNIQIFLLVNFRYAANVFYLNIGESSYSAQLVEQALSWNRWNQESAGCVYINISRSHARHAARSPTVVRTWMNQSETLLLFFYWNQSETILLQGSPELFLPGRHAQTRAPGSRLFLPKVLCCAR